MKSFALGLLVMFLVFVVLFVYLHRVGTHPRHNASGPDEAYQRGLTESALRAVAPASPEQGEAWLDRVRGCFGTFSVENLSATIHDTYAETFYFRDAFHTLTDRQTLYDYFLLSARVTPGVTFTYGAPIWNGIDVYLPWTMHVPAGKFGGDAHASMGMSHLRYDADGRLIFHQDFWDSADVLVPRVPVANGLIELVRRRY